MATKKVSAKTVVAEQPVKKATTTTQVAAVTPAVKPAATAPKTVAATPKAAVMTPKTATPAAEKSVVTSKVTFSLPKEAVENAETVAVLGDCAATRIEKMISPPAFNCAIPVKALVPPMKPVLAKMRPLAGELRMRFSSVPETPATASEER